MKFNTATTSISLLFYSITIQNVAASQSKFTADNIRPGRPTPRPRDSTKRESRMRIRPSPPSSSASLRLEGATPISALDERYQEEQHDVEYVASDTDTDADAGVDTYTYSLEFDVDMDDEPILDDCLDRGWQDQTNDSNFTWGGFLVQLPDDSKFLTGGYPFTRGTSDNEGNALIRGMLLHGYEFTTGDEQPTISVNFNGDAFLETFKFDFPDGGEYQEISKDLNGVLGCSDDNEPEDFFIEESPDEAATTNQTLTISLRRVRRVTTLTSSAVIPSGKFVGIATAAVVLVSAFL